MNIREKEAITLVEKNTEDTKPENNEENSKKHRWLGIIIIALLLLFIGIAGYYLEIDLEPLSDNMQSTEQLEIENGEENREEEQGIIDRILSVLGLNESEFKQNINILFIGLDDEESVALGLIEADSIVLGQLKAEDDLLQLEYIDEDQLYNEKILKKYSKEDLKPAVEKITDQKIDYHVYVNYQGFEKVIDELGGVKLNLEQEIKVKALGLDLKSGSNLLSGKEALNFVRWKSSNYLSRQKRQKMLVAAVIEKLRSTNIIFNVKELYNTIVESYNSVETDIGPVLAAEIFNYIRTNDELNLEFIE